MALTKRAFIWLLVVALNVTFALGATGVSPIQVEPSNPPHHFFDAKNVCLQSMSILGMAADVASTHRALEVPGTRELNPLTRSQGDLIALKLVGLGAGLGIAYMMHRSGHHKVERAIPLVLGVPSALAAAHNYGIHR